MPEMPREDPGEPGMGKTEVAIPAAYRCVLLKLSGEALMGSGVSGIDPATVDRIASEIRDVAAAGVRIGIVLGGGNILRGGEAQARGLNRIPADHMGMLATIINALYLRSTLTGRGIPAEALSALPIAGVIDPVSQREALRHLDRGRVVIFAGGTGNPFFTTDTAATLRALEIGAEVLLKATKVDGVYDRDPVSHPGARFHARLRYDDVLSERLQVMDATAVTLCREHGLPIVVFNLLREGNIRKVVAGEPVGTVVGG